MHRSIRYFNSLILILLLGAAPLYAQGPTVVDGKLPQLPQVLGPLGGLPVECIDGCSGSVGVTEPDDDNLAAGQTMSRTIVLPYIYDGVKWIRQTASSGGLTDTQLRATPVPVSFTTPIAVSQSGTWNIATVTTVTTVGAVTSITNPVAVTGTFFQAKQPISISQTTTDNDVDVLTLPAITIGNTGFNVNNTPAVTNTNLDVALSTRLADATYTGRTPAGASPATGETNTNTALSRIGTYNFVFNGTTWDRWTGAVTATLAAETTKVIGTVNQGTNPWAVSFTRLASGTDNVTIVPQALTKGTQNGTGIQTQDFKDAGRTAISFYANNVASGTTTTETLITLTQSKGTGATSSASTYTITSGKTLRITAISVGSRGNATATIQSTVFNLRLNTAGACVVTSTPILMGMQSATAAVASDWDRVIIPIPDGYEIAGNGTIALCISAAATFVTNAPTWSVNIVGFEY